MTKLNIVALCILSLFGTSLFAQIAPVYAKQAKEAKFRTARVDNQNENLIFVFDEPTKNLMFSVSPSAFIARASQTPKNIEIEINGLGLKGEKIIPQFSVPTNDASLISISDNRIQVKAGLIADIHVYFKQELSELVITSNNKTALQKIEQQFYSFQVEEFVKNPSIDCINHIALMLDGSGSMKFEERIQIKENIENWLQMMRTEQPEVSISILMFDNEAVTLIDRINVTDQAKIATALKNYVNLQQNRHTDWSKAFNYLRNFSVEEQRPDLIVFITDTPPNYLDTKETTGVVSLSHASNAANQLKAMGIRLVAIGTDKFNNHNIDQWFPFISGFEQRGLNKSVTSATPPTIHKNNYIALDHYHELEEILKSINTQCLTDSEKKRASLDIYPNPSAALFNIELKLPDAGNYSLEVFDFLGRRVWEKKQISHTEQIVANDWPAGTYLLHCIEKDSKKIIVTQPFVKVK